MLRAIESSTWPETVLRGARVGDPEESLETPRMVRDAGEAVGTQLAPGNLAQPSGTAE